MCDISRDSFVCDDISYDSDEVSKRCVPTQTQIRQQLGAKLSNVFFEYVGNEGKAYLGLEPPLEGPEVMWIHPDARLNNNVRVTPAPDPASLYLKVFTHEKILEVGQEYIQKLANKCRLEQEEALLKQAKELEEACVRRLDALSALNAEESKVQCKKIVATLMEHFDTCFNDMVNTMRLRLRKEAQLRVEEERAEVGSYMLTKLQEEVEHRDFELCDEFHDILFSELNVLASRYIKQINDEREVAVKMMQETVRNYENMMQELRVQLEINNVVDLCRAITQERVTCRETAKEMTKDMREKENEFQQYIESLQAENCTLRKMATERLKRLMQWRKKVRELLYEFQRYINFALKSVPGQSEFMLNMEKLMLKNFPEDSFLYPEDYLNFKNCIKDKKPPSEEKEPPKHEECVIVSDICESTESEAAGEAETEARTPPYCHQDDSKAELTFDYDRVKKMLTQKYAADLIKPKTKKKKKAICLWKKVQKEVGINKSCELYQMMAIAGENEKEHLAPLDCFLLGRLNAIKKICEDDPEFATAILGCSEK